jgi:hypothetical protein
VAFVDTGDYNQKDPAFASDIHITPNGKVLYGAVRTTSMLHGYEIDPEMGTLTGIGKWPTEKTPARLQHRSAREVPAGFSEPDRPCDRPEERRAEGRQAISDGQAAELGRDRR